MSLGFSIARLTSLGISHTWFSSSAMLRRAASIGNSSAEISSLQSPASLGRLGSLSGDYALDTDSAIC